MQGLLKTLALASELLCFVSTLLITDAVLHVSVLLANILKLDLLLVNDSSQRIDDCLKLLDRLHLSVSQLDGVSLG